MWLRDLLAPRHIHHSGTALYRRTRTDSDNAADFIFEPLLGPALDPAIRGYVLHQGPGLQGATPAPILQLAKVPIGAGYVLGEVRGQRLYNSRYSLSEQEMI